MPGKIFRVAQSQIRVRDKYDLYDFHILHENEFFKNCKLAHVVLKWNFPFRIWDSNQCAWLTT